jgi:predicted ArsR family transcriptional regulator
MEEREVLRTEVDDFLELIKKHQKVSLPDAAKEMRVPVQTIQAWTDFLVEEGIVGIEYKFTTPYVYIEERKKGKGGIGYLGFDTKETFYEKAKKRNIAEGQIRLLWLKYLQANEDSMKKVFSDKCRERGMPVEKVDLLWKKYYTYLKSEELK